LRKKLIIQFRNPVSGLTHFFSAIAALLGLFFLIYAARGNRYKEIWLVIYGVSLIFMFSASAAYHLVQSEKKVIHWLRIVDHSAIYILIAGTYTPLCFYYFTGFWRWGLMLIIWIMAFSGVIINFFAVSAPRWITAGIYLIMGWFSILAIREMVRTMPTGAIVWLITGGVLFTIGAVIYMLKKPDPWPNRFGFHEIWHIFVILGCLAHFIMIALYVAIR